MLQKFKITSYAFIVVFMTVQVFTIPAFGIHGPPHPKTLPTIDEEHSKMQSEEAQRAREGVPQKKRADADEPKPHIDKSTMPKIEGGRKMAVEPAKEGAVQNEARERFDVAYQRVIDCNVGLSAYISAMTELLTGLQTQQDDFTVRIEECAINVTIPNCEVTGMLYYDMLGDIIPRSSIPRRMVNAIRNFKGNIHYRARIRGTIEADLSTACMWQGTDPNDHYR